VGTMQSLTMLGQVVHVEKSIWMPDFEELDEFGNILCLRYVSLNTSVKQDTMYQWCTAARNPILS
jgi:hypothetical protein